MADRLQARPITDDEASMLADSAEVQAVWGLNTHLKEENVDTIKQYFICIPDYITDGPGYSGKLFISVAGALGEEFQPLQFYIEDGKVKWLEPDTERVLMKKAGELVGEILDYESDTFSASGSGITTDEARKIAGWLIKNITDSNKLDGETLQRLLDGFREFAE